MTDLAFFDECMIAYNEGVLAKKDRLNLQAQEYVYKYINLVKTGILDFARLGVNTYTIHLCFPQKLVDDKLFAELVFDKFQTTLNAHRKFSITFTDKHYLTVTWK